MIKLKLSKRNLIALLLPAFLLVGCGDDDDVKQVQAPVAQQQQQVQQQQPQVVYVQPEQPQQPQVIYEQAPQQQAPVIVNQPSSGIGMEHIAAGAVGYMMGRNSGNNSNYDRNHTVVNKTIVNKTYVNQKPANVYSGSKSFSNSSVPRGNTCSFSSSGTYKSKPVKSYSSKRRR